MPDLEVNAPCVIARKQVLVVVLATLRAEGGPRLVLALARQWRPQGVEVRVFLIQEGPRDLEADFRDLGIKIDDLGQWPTRGRFRYFSLAFRVWKACRKVRPMALLCIPDGQHSFVALGAYVAKVPVILAHLGRFPYNVDRSQMRKYRIISQIGRIFTTSVVCCSDHVRRGAIAHLKLPPSSLCVVYNGIDVGQFSKGQTLHISSVSGKPLQLVMVGRLDTSKDYRTLVLAVAELLRRGLECRLNLIGDGCSRSIIEKLCVENGIMENVRFWSVRRDIGDILAQMDVFVFSVWMGEGLGIAMIEAMAAGVPIVASDVPACREVLDDGEFGLLVPPANADAMATAIAAIRADPAAALERAERARAKATRDFNIAQTARRYADLLGLRRGTAT